MESQPDSENSEFIVTDEMCEGLKRDYFLGPYADIVLGGIEKATSQVVGREQSDREEHPPEPGTH